MPINNIQIKRSKNTTLSSPSSVILLGGELFWLKPEDASQGSGRLYVGDGSTSMSNLKDIGYTDRQSITTNASNISDLQNKVGNWSSVASITSTIERDEQALNNTTSRLGATSSGLNNLCNLLTDTTKGIYYPTSDGNLPSTSNTSINIGNVFLAMNNGVDKDFDWDDNINLDNPGEWKSGNKDAKYVHNSKIYGFDARVGKIFDNKFGEKGIFGKDFIIYKTVGGAKQKVLEFIRSDNNTNDIAKIGGGEVTYGVFEGQNKSYLQSVNIKGSTISESYLSNSSLRGVTNAEGATINSSTSNRVVINNPNIVNPLFSDGFINKASYFQNGIVGTNAIADASVTAAKLATGALQPNKIQGKTGTTSVLYSDTNGNVYWGTAPNTSGALSTDSSSYTNYLAYFKGPKVLGGKVVFANAKTDKFLNENGTWQTISVPTATYNSLGAVKPSEKDFQIGESNKALVIRRTSPMASSIAILTQYESSLTDQTAHYVGKIYGDGKTLVFMRQYNI